MLNKLIRMVGPYHTFVSRGKEVKDHFIFDVSVKTELGKTNKQSH